MRSQASVLHLDLDAFFASVELLTYPELRGEAVVVGGRGIHPPRLSPDGTRAFARLRDYAGRGVVTTSTYPARALGVFRVDNGSGAAELPRADIGATAYVVDDQTVGATGTCVAGPVFDVDDAGVWVRIGA